MVQFTAFLLLVSAISIVVLVLFVHLKRKAALPRPQQRVSAIHENGAEGLQPNGRSNNNNDSMIEDHAGEVSAAVVLRHRSTASPPPRHRRMRVPREVMHAHDSGTDSDSDINPVALRQKPVEAEMTEEMRILQECAVVGIVRRGDDVRPPP
ncbi:hypothetical protein DQ04_07981010, partial [Trypanosoma grayi]|uniref:hypothetical protein n=1 Tax=Trypanosoma grayi TaxID=71804 RepID=UPI0004F48316